jgi:hypothetical protein
VKSTKITFSVSLAACKWLPRFKHLPKGASAVIAEVIAAAEDEYVEVTLDAIDADFLRMDLTHEIVHGRYSRGTLELMDEVVDALEHELL